MPLLEWSWSWEWSAPAPRLGSLPFGPTALAPGPSPGGGGGGGSCRCSLPGPQVGIQLTKCCGESMESPPAGPSASQSGGPRACNPPVQFQEFTQSTRTSQHLLCPSRRIWNPFNFSCAVSLLRHLAEFAHGVVGECS